MAMPQPLHIFRKDLIHLWPETLISLLLFVTFAVCAPSGWTSSQYAVIFEFVAGLLKFLMPVSWLVIISRLIHDESLVGDRQFWTSRPYHWANLLAAKLLYLVGFLYLPFLIMQVYLLKHAGLYPTTVIPDLLHNLLLLTVIIVIPLTAIAAVTGTFARMLLSVLGGIIYIIILSVLISWLAFRRMTPPTLEPIFTGLFILLPAVALIYQYATRRTTESRIMLIATPLVITILLIITPATALIRHSFPVAGSGGPALSATPNAPEPQTGKLRVVRGEVSVTVPVAVSGIDPKTIYIIRGVATGIDGAGTHWASPYLSEFAGQDISAFDPVTPVNFAMPVDTFNAVRKTPSDVHLSLAVNEMKISDTSTWTATRAPFAIPGHGICSFSIDPDEVDAPPTCRFPFKVPENTAAAAALTVGPCDDPRSPHSMRRMTLSFFPSIGLDFDPVVTMLMNFRNPMETGPPQRGTLCPGTPLLFTQADDQGKKRLEVDMKGVTLDPLAMRVQDRNNFGPPR